MIECLSGDAPIQGSECYSVAEMMYSCETLLSIGGNPFWGDLLEREAFNSMPATTTPDMWAHQYLQMTNQISAARIPDAENPYNSNNNEANMFGLEPHFGCCTANFNQAWPKFAISAVMKNERGPVVQSLVPAVHRWKHPTELFRYILFLSTFRDNAVIELSSDKPAETCLQIRIPGFDKESNSPNGQKSLSPATGTSGHEYVLYHVNRLHNTSIPARLVCDLPGEFCCFLRSFGAGRGFRRSTDARGGITGPIISPSRRSGVRE